MAIVGLVAFGHIDRGLPGAGEAGLFVAIGGAVQTVAALLHRRPSAAPVAVLQLQQALGRCAARAPGERQEHALLVAIAGVEEVLASPAVSTRQHAAVRDLGRRARELLHSLMRRPRSAELDATTRDSLRDATDHAAELARSGEGAGARLPSSSTIVSESSAVVMQLIGAASARSTAFRHGVRLAVLLTVCWAVAHLLDLDRGYWVPLTAALVLKPDHDETVVRGGSRIVGTCLGAAVVGLLAVALHPQWGGTAAMVTVLAAIGLATFRASTAVGIGGYSGAIVLLLGFAASDTSGTASARVVDALIGGLLAIAVYVVWPGPSKADVGGALARALHCQRDALSDLHRFASGRVGARRRQIDAWAPGVAAEDAVALQATRADAEATELVRAHSIVLSLRRLRLAAAQLDRSLKKRDGPSLESFTRFGEWVERSLRALEDAATRLSGAPPAPWRQPPGDPWPDPLEGYVSEVSDSIGSIATMLSWPRPADRPSGMGSFVEYV